MIQHNTLEYKQGFKDGAEHRVNGITSDEAIAAVVGFILLGRLSVEEYAAVLEALAVGARRGTNYHHPRKR